VPTPIVPAAWVNAPSSTASVPVPSTAPPVPLVSEPPATVSVAPSSVSAPWFSHVPSKVVACVIVIPPAFVRAPTRARDPPAPAVALIVPAFEIVLVPASRVASPADPLEVSTTAPVSATSTGPPTVSVAGTPEVAVIASVFAPSSLPRVRLCADAAPSSVTV
jgi:hypothetical protein